MEFIWQSADYDKMSANLRKSPEVMLAGLNRALRKIGQLMVPALKAETPVGASHHLRNYTVGEVKGRGQDQVLEIRQAAASRKGYFYGMAVRGGSRPHFPPSAELIPWVQAVLGVNAKEAPGVAFLVARKISKVGTKPNPYHARALAANMGNIQAIVEQEGVAIMGRLANTK